VRAAAAILLVFLAVPPLVLVASDLWLLLRAGEARGEAARVLIMQSVDTGWVRHLERRYVLSGPVTGAGPAVPLMTTQMPASPSAELVPMCAGAVYEGDALRKVPPHAYSAVEHAEFSLAIRRMGVPGLLAYDACFNASPFAGWCGGAFRRARRSSQGQIEAEVVRSGVARRENGRACWCTMPCGWPGAAPPSQRTD
jgi:hypothetical protein